MQAVVLMLACAAVVVGCGGSTDAQAMVGARQSATEKHQAATRQLWGRGFVATSVFMGHSSIKVTFDLYGHLMPGTEAEAAALLDDFLDHRTN